MLHVDITKWYVNISILTYIFAYCPPSFSKKSIDYINTSDKIKREYVNMNFQVLKMYICYVIMFIDMTLVTYVHT